MFGLLAAVLMLADPPGAPQIVLLAPGLQFSTGAKDETYVEWIRIAREFGYAYKGTVHVDGAHVKVETDLDEDIARLVEKLAKAGTPVPEPKSPLLGHIYVLHYSPYVTADGLIARALELRQAVAVLAKRSPRGQVSLVAHSAAGLAARCYLQGMLPSVPFTHDVDRLVTIATPHLGASASRWASKFPLGPNILFLHPDAPILVELRKRPLPPDVGFASLVIRGLAADTTATGSEYCPMMAWSQDKLDLLPVDFQRGGDQILHVCTQNLALCQSAVDYEKQTGRPVWYWPIRVEDPTPNDRPDDPVRDPVHNAALRHREVVQQTLAFLDPTTDWWRPAEPKTRRQRLDQWCQISAFGYVEARAPHYHYTHEVTGVSLEPLKIKAEPDASAADVEFEGLAQFTNRAWRSWKSNAKVTGAFQLKVDPFGRVESVAWAP